jgi:hypothetical protein
VTTNVPKGANRASAAARTRKHAQRTALPLKAGSPGAEAIEEAAVAVYDSSGGKTLLREDLSGIQAGLIAVAVESHGDAPDDRSPGKARAFATKAEALGWKCAMGLMGGASEVTATRGAETVVQAWSGGVWSYEASIYAYGDRTTKPRNASGALKLLARSEADAAAEASKVQANRHFRKAEPKDIEQTLEKAQKSLPFDPNLATDEEITGVMAGQAIVWYNRIGRSNESAIVGRKGVRITLLPDGQRVANFCCPVTGYRSCLVTAILRVGRGRSLVTKGSPTEGSALVEVS